AVGPEKEKMRAGILRLASLLLYRKLCKNRPRSVQSGNFWKRKWPVAAFCRMIWKKAAGSDGFDARPTSVRSHQDHSGYSKFSKQIEAL
ncbi:MAG: hypothetical protein Q4F18_14110, partial [Clostridia bacterium]|nr:hypothetical protein [Clostridia bacterium]